MTRPFELLVGDCREVLPTLDAESAHCVVTSPPYMGLRKYGAGERELGQEETLDDYVGALVEVFGEVRRVLRKDGVAWLNIGDAYAGSGRGEGDFGTDKRQVANKGSYGLSRDTAGRAAGLARKGLMLVPERVALALQADGWIIRQLVIWAKTRYMPESVRDRDTCAHEHVWMLTRSQRYWYDLEAVRTPPSVSLKRDRSSAQNGTILNVGKHIGQKTKSASLADPTARAATLIKNDGRGCDRTNVWRLPTANHVGGHFATFPEALPAQCILSSCPPGGVVLDPFAGSGTTGKVAIELGRRAVLIELNPAYAKAAEARCASAQPGFNV